MGYTVLSLSLTNTAFWPPSTHFLAQAASTLAPHFSSLIQPVQLPDLPLLLLEATARAPNVSTSTKITHSFFIGILSSSLLGDFDQDRNPGTNVRPWSRTAPPARSPTA